MYLADASIQGSLSGIQSIHFIVCSLVIKPTTFTQLNIIEHSRNIGTLLSYRYALDLQEL